MSVVGVMAAWWKALFGNIPTAPSSEEIAMEIEEHRDKCGCLFLQEKLYRELREQAFSPQEIAEDRAFRKCPWLKQKGRA